MFGASELHFLGHHITPTGVIPLPQQVQTIRDFPKPTTLHKLRKFLGLVNFYHRFIPHCTTIMTLHSTQYLSQRHPTILNCLELKWTDIATTVFQEIKDALANATLLVHPQPDAPINVMTDASDITIGAVLQQYLDGQ